MSEGERLTDNHNHTWILGKPIGSGAFAQVYLVSREHPNKDKKNSKFICKIESHSNKTFHDEENVFIKILQVQMIKKWKEERKMKALGLPHYVESGSHQYRGNRYGFLIQPRFGTDLEKMFIREGRRFNIKTAFTITLYVIDILQYLHEHEYVHGDIKLSNLLLGLDTDAPVYLVDYGLATQFTHHEWKHKKSGHVGARGTLPYTSRDAHIGVFSRRGDLEILGFNLVQWLCGQLPWENESDPKKVHANKVHAMEDVTKFVAHCFKPNFPPTALRKYLQYVTELEFDSRPNYEYCKMLFNNGIREAGFRYDGQIHFHSNSKRLTKKRKLNT